ncbi:MAG: TlpA disulfide reductase family protein [Bryobacteraceae bacterium]
MRSHPVRSHLALAACAALVAATIVVSGCSESLSVFPGFSGEASRKAALKPATERKAAFDFALKDDQGRTVNLSDYRGRVVLLDFWATWCGPCKIEIPWFKEFERTYKDRGFSVVGVSMDEEGWDAVTPFAKAVGINYRMLVGNDDVADAFGGLAALPTTFLIDREGKIAAMHVGLASKSDFEDGIKQLLDAPGGSRAAAGSPAGAN